ncbi:cofilin [Arthrobotrys musiformis]|uniref:Cofilin n=1 Tax=Arthrobotrys musiformis TaxID=47236 RepID=A0AAV9W5W3_9PEZI
MSRSGVTVSSECVTAFEELKLRKSHQYIVYALGNNDTEIVIEAKGEPNERTSETNVLTANYEEFVKVLPPKDCRWIIYDFAYKEGDSEIVKNKIVFISWSPDNAPIRSKMTYSSSKDALRRAFNGVAAEIQGTDSSEVSYEALKDKVAKK